MTLPDVIKRLGIIALGYDITNICCQQTHLSFQMDAGFHGNSFKVYRLDLLNVHQI